MQSFSDLNLSPKVLRAIEELGYTEPSPIQAQALPLLLGNNTDFLGLAATGTGKTAAFTIPLLERLDPNVRQVQGLILCPTRELAMQVTDQVNLLGKYLGVTALPIYGGASYNDQHRGLHRGVSVVVGTPGRICDHIRQGTLNLEKLQVLVLDEADEMISMGFKDDLMAVLDSVPDGQANTWLFSATMSPDVRRVADTYLKNPAQVQVNRSEMVPTTIEQLFYITHESSKPDVLCKLIDSVDDFYGLIFCQTKALVADLTSHLMDRGYRVDSLHGDKTQSAREITMKAFRERKVKILVCTDVAARGLDVKDVTHVMNYSIPRELDSYVHRIGRTARCGKSGVAMSLISPRQRSMVGQIERLTKSVLQEGSIPTRRELGAKKVSSFLAKFQEQENYTRAIESMGDEWKLALSTMTPEEIAGRFLALNFTDIFNDKDADLRAAPSRLGFVDRGDDRGDRGGRGGYDRDRGERPRMDRGGSRGNDRDSRSGGGSRDRDRGGSERPRMDRGEFPRRPAPFRAEGGPRIVRADDSVSAPAPVSNPSPAPAPVAAAAKEYRAPKAAAAVAAAPTKPWPREGAEKKPYEAKKKAELKPKRTFDPSESKSSGSGFAGKPRKEKRS
ncbi:MAG: DEAD/DEAH box helicase [Oligoflexus sp.]|nr:DEAD/DEAH box helicase [Oligoflexus sp.]